MTLHRTSDLEDGWMDILFYSILFYFYIILSRGPTSDIKNLILNKLKQIWIYLNF